MTSTRHASSRSTLRDDAAPPRRARRCTRTSSCERRFGQCQPGHGRCARWVINIRRTQRLFTGTARQAAQLLAVSCGHRGCDIPAHFCDVDHVDEWAADDGRTDQANALPLCGVHDRWQHRERLRGRRDHPGRIHLVKPDGTVIKALGARDPIWAESDEPTHHPTWAEQFTLTWAEYVGDRTWTGASPEIGSMAPSTASKCGDVASGVDTLRRSGVLRWRMPLGLVTIVVDDYDRGIAHYVDDLGFTLVDVTSTRATSAGRRCSAGYGRRASGDAPPARCRRGRRRAIEDRQPDRRQGLSLSAHGRLHSRPAWMSAAGVTFLEAPRHEPYGTVAVFQDAFGNRWDLLQPQ